MLGCERNVQNKTNIYAPTLLWFHFISKFLWQCTEPQGEENRAEQTGSEHVSQRVANMYWTRMKTTTDLQMSRVVRNIFENIAGLKMVQ